MSKTSVVYYVMGVSGAGKTTVGQALARRLNVPFFDGDDFHPPSNISKMASGQSLTDEDRAGWLDAIYDFATKEVVENSLVIACSALKASYRQKLSTGTNRVQWVYLQGEYDLIERRMQDREHFMPPDLLQSQFDALEEPHVEDAIIVSIDQPVEVIIEAILTQASA